MHEKDWLETTCDEPDYLQGATLYDLGKIDWYACIKENIADIKTTLIGNALIRN